MMKKEYICTLQVKRKKDNENRKVTLLTLNTREEKTDRKQKCFRLNLNNNDIMHFLNTGHARIYNIDTIH